MKVLLAKSANVTSSHQAVIPPLGLLYLASYLKQVRPRDQVRFVDLRTTPSQEYVSLLQSFAPDVVGISSMTMEAVSAHEMSAIAKSQCPTAKVVMGGPHPTSYTDEVLADRTVDYTVLHEGELTFSELLDRLEDGGDLTTVAGIAFREQDGTVHTNRSREYVKALDELPMPQWDLVDFANYDKCKPMGLPRRGRVVPMFTSRACPYRCTYCHDMFGKLFQKRSVDNVLDEMQYLVEKYRVDRIEIVDDIFNIDRVRTAAILQGMLDRRLKVRLAFPNGLRGDLLTDDLIDLFARAGTEHVCLAVETASPRLQKKIKKNLHFPRIEAAIRGFVRRRVFTTCFYMLGFPDETMEEMQATVDFACRQPSHAALFMIVHPFKGTELSDETGQAYLPTCGSDESGFHNPNISINSNLPPLVLNRAARMAYLRFFSNPARLLRIFRDYPDRRQLWRMMSLQFNRLLFDPLNQRLPLQITK